MLCAPWLAAHQSPCRTELMLAAVAHPEVRRANAGRPYFHGLLAFALEQCGRLEEAEAEGRRGTEVCAGDSWSHHAVAHSLYFQVRADPGHTRRSTPRRDHRLPPRSAGWRSASTGCCRYPATGTSACPSCSPTTGGTSRFAAWSRVRAGLAAQTRTMPCGHTRRAAAGRFDDALELFDSRVWGVDRAFAEVCHSTDPRALARALLTRRLSASQDQMGALGLLVKAQLHAFARALEPAPATPAEGAGLAARASAAWGKAQAWARDRLHARYRDVLQAIVDSGMHRQRYSPLFDFIVREPCHHAPRRAPARPPPCLCRGCAASPLPGTPPTTGRPVTATATLLCPRDRLLGGGARGRILVLQVRGTGCERAR